DALADVVARTPGVEINTDDRNVVEFGLARSMGRLGSALVVDLRTFSAKQGFLTPPIDDPAAVSRAAADTAWLNFNGWDQGAAQSVADAGDDERLRREALRRYYEAGDPAGARDSWRRQTGQPRDPDELAMVADVEAAAGSESAEA